MTISTTIIKNSYSGNGSTSAFTYNFKITDDDDIQVIIRSSTGTETVKSKGTHYNVAGVGNNSGTVTFTSGNIPASGETVVLRRSTPKTQAMDLIDNDPMSADTIETAHDKVISITQELQEQIDRSLKLSRTNTMTSTEFTTSATDRANKVLAFDSSGELSIAQELGTFKGNWAASTVYVQRDIVKDTSTNNIFIAVTAHTSSGSQPLTTNTDSAKWSLLVDAASAATSATAAASSATAAASSATAAASSATTAAGHVSTASGHKDTASTKASEAASSATAAAASATAAAASLDSFDDVYLGAKSSAPTVDNDGDALTTGDLYYNTSANTFNYYTGSTWTEITSGGITSVAADTTPQLGGHLDTNEKEIQTVSNRDLLLAPNGTGVVEVKGNTNPGTIQLNCESNSHGIKLISPAHSSSQSYSIKFPTNNIAANKYLKVDSITGSGTTAVGQLSFADVDAGGSDISTLGQVFGNYKEVDSDATITTAATRYQFLFGPISVTGSAVLTIGGDGSCSIFTFANLT